MTEKGQRHDRRGSRRRHLLVAAATVLVVGAGCGRGRPEGSTPLAPEALRLAYVASTAIDVRIRPSGGDWSPWIAVTDSMALASPIGTALLQFRYLGGRSSLSGWSFPNLNTCFIMPGHEVSESAWRVSYGLEPGVYPEVGRIEFRSGETHVTEARHHTMWFQAEVWGDGAYMAASPWFKVRFDNDTALDVHDEGTEEL